MTEALENQDIEEMRQRVEGLFSGTSEDYERLKAEEVQREQEIFSETRRIKDRYKSDLVTLSINSAAGERVVSEMPEDMRISMEAELAELNKRYSKNGVYYMYCQFYRIIDAVRSGKRLEYETMGTYLSDYDVRTGEIWRDKRVIDDQIGIELMKRLVQTLKEGHPVALIDDMHIMLTDSTSPTGKPLEDGSRMGVSDEVSASFKENFVEDWKENGIISQDAIEGPDADFLVLKESEKTDDAEKLVDLLEAKGLVQRCTGENDQSIYFQNSIAECEDPRYMRIKLRGKNGNWECAALDASGFIEERNREIIHLVCLPKDEFEEQQAKVWEILKALGFEPLNYHNIFFDPKDEAIVDKNGKLCEGVVADTVTSLMFGQAA